MDLVRNGNVSDLLVRNSGQRPKMCILLSSLAASDARWFQTPISPLVRLPPGGTEEPLIGGKEAVRVGTDQNIRMAPDCPVIAECSAITGQSGEGLVKGPQWKVGPM